MNPSCDLPFLELLYDALVYTTSLSDFWSRFLYLRDKSGLDFSCLMALLTICLSSGPWFLSVNSDANEVVHAISGLMFPIHISFALVDLNLEYYAVYEIYCSLSKYFFWFRIRSYGFPMSQEMPV